MPARSVRFQRGVDSGRYKSGRSREITQSRRRLRRQDLKRFRDDLDQDFTSSFLEERHEKIIALCEIIAEHDRATEKEAMQRLRHAIIPHPHPHDLLQEIGIIPHIVQNLENEDRDVRYYAAWILSNLTCGASKHTAAVVDAQAVGALIELLGDSMNENKLREQCAWTLANIAGDAWMYRNLVLSNDGLDAFAKFLSETTSTSCQSTCLWAIGNCFRHNPRPPFHYCETTVPSVMNMLVSSDEGVVKQALWTLTYMTDRQFDSDEDISIFLNNTLIPNLFKLYDDCLVTIKRNQQDEILCPLIRTIGNLIVMLKKKDVDLDEMLDQDLLKYLQNTLVHAPTDIQATTLWCLSNVCAIKAFYNTLVIESGILNEVLQILSCDIPDLRREALWVVSNCLYFSDAQIVSWFVENGVIPPLCELLSSSQPIILSLVLDAFYRILEFGKEVIHQGENLYKLYILKCDGYSELERISNTFGNGQIRSRANRLLNMFFLDNEDFSDDELDFSSNKRVKADDNDSSGDEDYEEDEDEEDDDTDDESLSRTKSEFHQDMFF
eukprot:TRINITY_DN3256_c0_g7_i1.p1 TRINITY_DN3256_c0_g7~~TRINITY_DN3256_c0_g7_i1.p1  ORF type:complete len:560 (-),score=160.87 TRINITY_DN3256_c0_g7_i1:97-1752(-)